MHNCVILSSLSDGECGEGGSCQLGRYSGGGVRETRGQGRLPPRVSAKDTTPSECVGVVLHVA